MNGYGRKMAVAMGILAGLVPMAAWAAEAPQGREGRGGPPPEAVAACADRSEGTAVEFVNRRGDKVKAVCRPMGDRLVAVPDRAGAGPAAEPDRQAADDPAGDCGPGGKVGPERFLSRMTRVLDLSAGQQKQIEALLAADRDKQTALREKLAENRKRLREATRGESFDEAAVRVIATSQGQLMTEIIVSMARKRQQINAILTPQQRTLAEKIQPLLQGGGGHGPHDDGE